MDTETSPFDEKIDGKDRQAAEDLEYDVREDTGFNRRSMQPTPEEIEKLKKAIRGS